MNHHRIPKYKHRTEDYVLLSIPENQWLFAVIRKTHPEEKPTALDAKKPNPKETYQEVTHLVSPFWDYHQNKPGESCSCLSWRTRGLRCIHLRKFYEKNPGLEPPEIQKEAGVGIGRLAKKAAAAAPKGTQAEKSHLSKALQRQAAWHWQTNEAWRKKILGLTRKKERREAILKTMTAWLQTPPQDQRQNHT
jgi:hypothetical protein